MKFRFGSIKVDEVNNDSGVYYGTNYQHDVSHSVKTNEGFGDIDGDSNVYVNNVQVVFDEDSVDFLVAPDGGVQDE